MGLAGGDSASTDLPGKDISSLLDNPESASTSAIRDGALYNYNMFAYVDQDFFGSIGKFIAGGGKPEDLAKQGFRPNLKKRGAIRSVYDGQYKLNRYYSPLEHHVPKTLEQLFATNDIELFDVAKDPFEMKNLAVNKTQHAEIIKMMNDKLNLLLEQEVGDDVGQMLPTGKGTDWQLSSSIAHLRM